MLKSSNPTALQSQKWLIQALLDLMEIVEYDKISVSGLCRRAGLDRRTFYRNFDSKNDVLEQYIRLLGEEYMEAFYKIEENSRYAATEFFFEFWGRHLDFIKNMQGCGLGDFVFKQFETFAKSHRELLITGNLSENPPEVQSNYIFSYRIGGYWNAMLAWADNSTLISAKELSSLISRI